MKRVSRVVVVLLALIATAAGGPASKAVPLPRVEVLEPLPGFDETVGVEINDAGTVVGWSETEGPDDQERATIWRARRTSAEPVPGLGGSDSVGMAINNAGDVVGWMRINDQRHTFLLRAGATQVIDFGTGGGEHGSRPQAINSRRRIVGEIESSDSQVAFVSAGDSLDVLPDLGGAENRALDINDRDVIVGFARDGPGGPRVPVFWPGPGQGPLRLGLPPGATEGEATCINARGVIGGYLRGPGGELLPCTWKRTRPDRPALVPGFGTGPGALFAGGTCEAINSSGHLVGAALIGGAFTAAYLRKKGKPMNLASRTGRELWGALDINRRGRCLALGYQGGIRAFRINRP
jgi:hypothetical protein